MIGLELAVVRKPRRRTHLATPAGSLLCRTAMAMTGAECSPLQLAGGATRRLALDLQRELDGTACLRCTQIGLLVVALYGARDGGRVLL